MRYLKTHLAAEEWLQSLIDGGALKPPPIEALRASAGRPSKPADRIPSQLNCPAPPATWPTLNGALALYLEEKREEFESYRGREQQVRYNEKRRVIRYLIEALGSDREISSLTRADARTFRDYLKGLKLASGSLQKIMSIVAAIIQTSLTEHQIPIRNPFHRFPISDEVAAIEARLPLDVAELRLARSLQVNAELQAIVNLLAVTGARLNEIAGLDWSDIKFPTRSTSHPCIHIRSNAIRRLKTASSKRVIPLLPGATDTLLTLKAGLSTSASVGPVFPRYGRSGGSDAASAALMKALRKAGITDKRKSIHSIRHSVKQALRDVGCPKDIRDAIQGHSANDVAENYGLGHSLETMSRWLESAAARLEI